ncbi:MAG: hypothetical protein ACKVH1_05980, partial [Alphaproteobacteria bacterium]
MTHALDKPVRMENIEHIVTEAALTRFAVGLFAASGVPETDAELIAKVLIWSNLRGVDSHGVL